MKSAFAFATILLLLSGTPSAAAPPAASEGGVADCKEQGGDCSAGRPACRAGDDLCTPPMRGRCGKMRGDWYGARRPVGTAVEAEERLKGHFAGRGHSVVSISERKWGFRAKILDSKGELVDRVMIDKRSGRIRSLD